MCSAGSRLILERSLADKFLPKLAACRKTCQDPHGGRRDGRGDRNGTAYHSGASTEGARAIRVRPGRGAKLLCGGDGYTDDRAKGNFVRPTVFPEE